MDVDKREAGSNNNNGNSVINPAALSSQDRKLIQERYLGGGGERGERIQKARRHGDRRINFDWDPADDTSTASGGQYPLSPTGLGQDALNGRLQTGEPMVIRTVDKDGKEVERIVTDRGSRRLDDRHWSEKSALEMQERDWRILKEDFGISTTGGHLPHPLRYWREAPFPARLKEAIESLGYKDPTAIQRQAIPLIMAGRDMMGIAETGSGKTAAFILPMVCQILKLPPLTDNNIHDGPYGLVLAPTRELAQQIDQEARKFCRPLGLSCLSIVGGHSIAEQSISMRNGVEIVVATPGRLRDCLEQHVLVLNQCFSLVLDEADRMIDLNFEEDLNFILSSLPASMTKPDSIASEDPQKYLINGKFRQTTMFSATMPASVEKLARTYLRRPAIVSVGQAGKAAETVEQRVELVKEEDKDRRLLSILDSTHFEPPIIIFVNQKRTVDFLSQRLEALGHRCIALHGGKNQEQREVAITQLKRRTRDILIATDVAGRGIDIKDVSLVLNYDMAKSIEDYIHRIGRTGRMGKTGTAITFLTAEDADLFFDLRVLLQKAPKTVIPEAFLAHEASRTKPGTVLQRKRHEEKIFAYGV